MIKPIDTKTITLCALVAAMAACSEPIELSPGSTRDLAASVSGASVTLTWLNPDVRSFEGVVVARTTGATFDDPEDGRVYAVGDMIGSAVVVAAGSVSTVTDDNLACGIYRYMTWTRSSGGEYTEGEQAIAEVVATPAARVTQLDAVGQADRVDVTWTFDETAPNAHHVILVKATDAPPASSFDGTRLYSGTDRAYADLERSADAVHYAAFVCNACGHCETDGAHATVPGVVVIDPGPVPDLVGVRFEPGDAQVTLSWDAAQSDQIAGVRVVVKRTNDVQGPEDGDEVCDPCVAPFEHTGLDNGTTYYYGVFARDGSPMVRYSTGVLGSATPVASGSLPEVSGAAFNAGDGEVVISFTAPAEPAVAGVRIVAKATNDIVGPEDGRIVCDPCTSPVTDGGLTNEIPVYYRIYTFDGSNPVMFSAGVSGTATPVPPPPNDVRRAELIPRDEAVRLEWRTPNDLDFGGVRIVRKATNDIAGPQDGAEVCDPCTSPHVDGGLVNGTTYFYGLYVYNTAMRFSAGVHGSATPVAAATLVPLPTSVVPGGGPVAMAGNLAIVGVPLDDDAAADAGAVLIYERVGDTWSMLTKIVHPEAEAGAQFGCSVDITSDAFIAGACRGAGSATELDAGAAYIVRRVGTANSWDAAGFAKLTAMNPDNNDDFGTSVAIDGDYAVVTEPDNDDVHRNAGAAWVFMRTSANQWDRIRRLSAPDARANHRFGRGTESADIVDGTIVVAAYTDDATVSGGGALYFFERVTPNGFDSGTKVRAAMPSASAQFGRAVSLGRDVIAVGAWQTTHGGLTAAGAVHVLTRTNGVWTSQQELTASDAFAFANYGWSVGISGDRLIVGAARDGGGGDYGAAYLYSLDPTTGRWGAEEKLTTTPRVNNMHLGSAVAIDQGSALIANESASEPVYAYTLQ